MKKGFLSIVLFYLYLFIIFFYGVVVILTYSTSLINIIKYVPETILILFLLCVFYNFKSKFTVFDLFLLGFLLIIFILSFFDNYNYSSSSIFTAIRDLLIPIVSLVLLKTISFPEKSLNLFKKSLVIVSLLFLLVSLPFGLLQRINGWEYTSSFYTGFSFYGKDPKTGTLLINLSSGHVRALGLVGNSAKYGFYSFLSFVLVNCFIKKNNRIVFLISSVTAFFNIFFSTNKTSLVLLVVAVIWFFLKLFPKRLFDKRMRIALIVLVFAFISGYIFFNLDTFYSVAERFEVWKNDINNSLAINNYNILIGLHLYSYFERGASISVFDNSFLFTIFSLGLVFAFLLFAYLFTNLDFKNESVFLLFIALVFAGLSTNIFSGRVFFNVFCVICGIMSGNEVLKQNNKISFEKTRVQLNTTY